MRLALYNLLWFCLALPLGAQQRNVVLICVDGLQGIKLASLTGHDSDLPNLTEFVAKGAVSEGMIGVFPSVTAPSVASIVTGVSPAVHGILTNYLFDPEHKMDASDSANEYAELIHVPTVWSLAHKAGLRVAGVYWPATTAAPIESVFPNHSQMRNDQDRLLYRAISTPGLVAAYEKEYGNLPTGGRRFNEQVVTQMALFSIKTSRPNLLMVYFQDLDHIQHNEGPDSPKVRPVLKKIDTDIGVLREAINKAGLAATTDFVIVSDHGFAPVTQELHPNAILASLGLLGSQEHPEKWRVASYGGGGSFGLVVHHADDTEAINLATKTFQQLQRDGAWGVDQVLDRVALQEAKAYANCFAAINMKFGFTADAGDAGPWLSSSKMKGAHGHFPGPPDMDAAFAALGPGIPHVRLPRSRIVDVAPTVAAMLGLQMAHVEGVNLLKSENRP